MKNTQQTDLTNLRSRAPRRRTADRPGPRHRADEARVAARRDREPRAARPSLADAPCARLGTAPSEREPVQVRSHGPVCTLSLACTCDRSTRVFYRTYRDQLRFGLVAQDVGVALRDARRSVTSWCRRHTIGGDGAVAAVRRGQRQGEPGTLSREQELELIDVLRGVHPDEFGLDEELWTRQSLATLIQRRFDLPMDAGDGRGVPAGLGVWVRASRASGPAGSASARSSAGYAASTRRSPGPPRSTSRRSTGSAGYACAAPCRPPT